MWVEGAHKKGNEMTKICYLDFDELCNISRALRLARSRIQGLLAKGFAFEFEPICCVKEH